MGNKKKKEEKPVFFFLFLYIYLFLLEGYKLHYKEMQTNMKQTERQGF